MAISTREKTNAAQRKIDNKVEPVAPQKAGGSDFKGRMIAAGMLISISEATQFSSKPDLPGWKVPEYVKERQERRIQALALAASRKSAARASKASSSIRPKTKTLSAMYVEPTAAADRAVAGSANLAGAVSSTPDIEAAQGRPVTRSRTLTHRVKQKKQ